MQIPVLILAGLEDLVGEREELVFDVFGNSGANEE